MREVILAKKRRANIEAAAAKAGLTLDEYEAKQVEERRLAKEA